MLGITSTTCWQIANWILYVLSRANGSQIPAESLPVPAALLVESLYKRIILDLPTELLLQIFSYLPLLSQFSLALISKRFYQISGSALEAEELHFPRMRRNGHAASSDYGLRMALLMMLENEKWACCERCQRLHPRKELPASQLNHPPWRRTCMAWTGIVDLCPCISLTIHDRTRVVEYLKAPQSYEPNSNLINKGLLKRNGQYLSHQCTTYPHVQIDMQLSLTNSEQLTTATRY